MVLWVAIVGLFVWVSYEFLLRSPGEARRLADMADTGHSTQVLVASFLVALGISAVLASARVALAPLGIRWAACALLVCGLALRAWSMAILGRRYSRGLQVTKSQALVVEGPYRIIRHPGYAGSLLVWIGFALGMGSWAGALLVGLVLGAAYFYRIAAEERLLRTMFGPAYQTYQQGTWRLIPGLF